MSFVDLVFADVEQVIHRFDALSSHRVDLTANRVDFGTKAVATNPLQIRLDYGKMWFEFPSGTPFFRMWIFSIGCQMEIQLATKFYQRDVKPLPTLHYFYGRMRTDGNSTDKHRILIVILKVVLSSRYASTVFATDENAIVKSIDAVDLIRQAGIR